MNPQTDFIEPALKIVEDLTSSTLSGPEKLAAVTERITQLGENADNLAAMLPTIGPFVAWALDLPPVDDFEKQYIFRPIAEVIYQGYAFFSGAVTKLSDFGHGIVDPAVELINELARVEIPGTNKHVAVQARVLNLLLGVTNVTQFFPGGLRTIAEFALSTDAAKNALNALAGMIAEVLYQVWKLLHGVGQAQGVPATA